MTRFRAALVAWAVGLPPAAGAGLVYRVGPGDVLEVSVPGHPELSRLATVQTTGTISLGDGGEVPVAGLTVEEIGLKLRALWSPTAAAGPAVRVSVREYQSQFVRVAGAVVRPGSTPLTGATRIVDALVAAGGLTKAASGVVVVERREGTFADGSTSKRLFLSGSHPDAEELQDLETPLHPRDVLTVGKTGYVQVNGAVMRPGRYPLRRGTLAEALAAAGGTTKGAASRAKVSRVDPQTGKAQVLELDIESLNSGRDLEPRLRSEDEVTVPKRFL